MATLTINGASNDLVEIGGDFSDEFSPDDTERFFVVSSDGTVLTGKYDGAGVWRFTTHTAGTATMSKVEAPEDDEDNYSDVVTLSGDIAWVALASHVTK